jgi:hypothetical protein
LRIELELRQHAGRGNGKLIVTKEQFAEFCGANQRLIAPALRELEALGIVIVTERGRGGNAEHRQPNRFLLNYMCGAIDAHEQITNTWTRFETLKQAKKVASIARKAKDPTKVAYGRRNAEKQNISRDHLVDLVSGPLSVTETRKLSGPLSGPTSPGPLSGPTNDISGGGGAEGGKYSKKVETPPLQPELMGLREWTMPTLVEIERTDELRRLYRREMVEEAFLGGQRQR